jgi:hypothetical protein
VDAGWRSSPLTYQACRVAFCEFIGYLEQIATALAYDEQIHSVTSAVSTSRGRGVRG